MVLSTSCLSWACGLWQGDGHEERIDGAIVRESGEMASDEVFFLPQRPYMVLGTLRQQLLYPTWSEEEMNADIDNGKVL